MYVLLCTRIEVLLAKKNVWGPLQGIWGMLAPGLLATQADVAEAYPNLPNPAGDSLQ